VPSLTAGALLDALHGPDPAAALDPDGAFVGGGALVVDLRGAAEVGDPASRLRDRMEWLPAVTIAIDPAGHALGALCDVVVPDAAAADDVVDAVARRPRAATALSRLLRGGERRPVAAGLVAESATYSMLQAGPEHRAWLAERRSTSPVRGGASGSREPVRVRRAGDALRITLNRPHVRNAFDVATRDALLDALSIGAADPALAIRIDGDGPDFCSGGDLDEFGTGPDPASAHLLRLHRNVGHALHALAPRTTVDVHGASIGAGVELAAFARRVRARPDATFRLPEVAMGLVPGAGGTVSVPRRIGRSRALWCMLTGAALDAATALAWGLVDEIRDEPPSSASDG
jgi:enoyl-CoA hydratase/carnithine racemase